LIQPTDQDKARFGQRAAVNPTSNAGRRSPLLGPYIGYIGYFVGAGLISGAVVHHPLDPARYSVIAAAGVVLFLFATVLNEFVLAHTRPAAVQMARIVAASLLLSFGIGMVSGGLQHFTDFPARSAVLVPVGIVVSFAAFVVRHAADRWRQAVGLPTVLILALALLAFAILNYLATGELLPSGLDLHLEEEGAGGHGH
jgi:hypothetical protein